MKGILYCFLFVSLLACRQNTSRTSTVTVSMKGTSADSTILRSIPLGGGFSKKIDSGMLRFTRDSLVFELPLSADSLYEVSLKFSRNRLLFIPDGPDIRIIMDRKTGKNSISGSPASLALNNFKEEQDSLQNYIQMVWARYNEAHTNPEQKDSLNLVVKNMAIKIQDRYYHFGDTVSYAAAFLENFNYIEFQNDTTRMKNLLIHAQERFPQVAAIARLRAQVDKLIHIREKELQVGEIFPDLHLPDLDDQMYSTAEAKGDYVFIDFWASWCQKCLVYSQVKKDIATDPRFNKIVLISVAMDNRVKSCRDFVAVNHQPGIQLIDKDMWQGQSADKIAFDSIPFNFLLGPDQRILAKAIPPDSIRIILEKFVH